MTDTSKINEILNYYGLKTNIEETKKWVKQYVDGALTGITTDLMISATYEEIKGWRDNGELKPGMLYRMTDYVTKVYSEDGSVSSAEHPFDLILFANSNKTLNENAFATLHDGDEYFKDCKLNAWEIKYSLDNDDDRFEFGTYNILNKGVCVPVGSETWLKSDFGLYMLRLGYAFEYYDEEEHYTDPGFDFCLQFNEEISRRFDRNQSLFREYIRNIPENWRDDVMWETVNEQISSVHCDLLGRLNIGNIDKYGNPGDVRGVSYDLESKLFTNNTVLCPQLDNTTYIDASDGSILYILKTKQPHEHVLCSFADVYSVKDYQIPDFIYFSRVPIMDINENTVLYTGDIMDDNESVTNLQPTDVKFKNRSITLLNELRFRFKAMQNQIVSYCTLKNNNNYKGIIYYMKDEFNNEAPFDFKNILFKDGDYTFGSFDEDYSLNGYANGVYNNKILPQVDTVTGRQTINQIRVTEKNCHSNLFKPSCVNSYIDFPISECDISMNNDGELVVFKTQDFVSGIENHTIEHDYRKDYLTFEAVNDDTEIIFKETTDYQDGIRTIEISKDKINWEPKTSSSEGIILATLNAGECLYLRGNNSSYGYYYDGWDEYLPNFILPLNYCYVYGNVMSLIDSNNFRTLTEITDEYAFFSLFSDSWNGDYSSEYVLSHQDKKLELPATTLAQCCYNSMFLNCSSLTTAPELPATTLANDCYSNMFSGCSNLETAPELPATTLESYCYHYMFYNCTSLETAPELPATTLASYCYTAMFSNCSSLTTAPELPATTLTQCCYQNMFSNCTSLTTVPELHATTLADTCYGSMFRNCTSLATAPALPATTLANYCYYYMFDNCRNLKYIKCLAINGINQNNSTTVWVYGVASTGTFVKHPDATSWPTGYNGIPTNWTVEDAVLE